ncbi:MAG TPA: hypothetical protein VER03_14135 [Bryobacteraceae bacterium]|nr:hypothetical protein [Bryobacteraceae bacterium]
MWRAIAIGGLVSGVLDISAAITQYGLRGVPAARILQSVAAGLLGRAAYAGGAATAMLGLALHFVIAFGATAVYYSASRRMPLLTRHAVPAGMLYGMVVFFFMNRIVVPLSNFPGGGGAFNLQAALPQIAIHMLCVGLPIALAVRRYGGLQVR